MASGIKKMREEAGCSVCLRLMTEPVTIECGHNFCQKCIEGVTENQQVTSSPRSSHCPLCRAPFEKDCLKPNEQLENLIKIIKEMEHERMCEEHGEQLELFCRNDEQLICWSCEQSPQHRAHNTAVVEDVYPEYKEKLQETLTRLKKDQDFCESGKLFTGKQIIKWQEDIEDQRKKIQAEFRNLHNFLHAEEKCHLWRLENKKEQNLSSSEVGEANLEKQSNKLESLILELEKICQDPGLDLLQSETGIQTQKIKCDFEKPHNFLHEKEKLYLERLEEEKIQMLKRLQDIEASFAKQSYTLDILILELEKKCQYPAQKLFQDVKDTLSRCSAMKLVMPEAVSLELRTECPFSKIYSEMKEKFLLPGADSSAVEHRADEGQSGAGLGLGSMDPESPSKGYSEARVRFAPYSKRRVPTHYRYRRVHRPAQEPVSCTPSRAHPGSSPSPQLAASPGETL